MELTQIVPITHKYGLHARASQRFAEVATSFDSQIFISKDGGHEADGKSIVGLLTLGAEMGNSLHLRVEGADAEKCMAALVALIQDNFGGV